MLPCFCFKRESLHTESYHRMSSFQIKRKVVFFILYLKFSRRCLDMMCLFFFFFLCIFFVVVVVIFYFFFFLFPKDWAVNFNFFFFWVLTWYLYDNLIGGMEVNKVAFCMEYTWLIYMGWGWIVSALNSEKLHKKINRF